MVRTTLADGQALRRRRSRARSPDASVPSGTTRRSAAAHGSASTISGRRSRVLARRRRVDSRAVPPRPERLARCEARHRVGTITRPTVRATLAARDVRTADWPASSVDATLSVDRGGLRVHRLDARADPARLNASGDYVWSGRGNVRFDATVSDIGELARRFQTTPLAMSGSAHLEGHVAGTVDRPRGQATLTADEVDDRRNVHRPRRRHDRARRHTGAGRCGRAGSRCAGPSGSGHRQPLSTTTPRPASSGRRSPRPFPPVCGINRRSSEGVITGSVRARGTLSRPLEVAGTADLDELERDPEGHAHQAATIRNPGRLAGSDHRRARRPRRRPDHARADVGNARDDGGGGAASSSSQRSARRSHRDCRSAASTRDAASALTGRFRSICRSLERCARPSRQAR